MLLYYFRAKIAPGPWSPASTNLQSLSGKVSPAHVFIHPACQTKKVNRPAPPVTEPTWRKKLADKDRQRKRWIEHAAQLEGHSENPLPSGRRLWKRSSSYSACRTVWASLAFLNDNPLHSPLCGVIITSSTSDPGFTSPPLTPKRVASDVENTVIHPYFRRVWKCEISSEYDSFTGAASKYWKTWVSHPARADIMSRPVISNPTVFASLSCVTVSLGTGDSALLIIQQQIKAILQQIASLIMKSWVRSVLERKKKHYIIN